MFSFTIRHLIDVVALLVLYIFVLFPKWKRRGGGVLFIWSVMYVYLCFVLFFTMMPIITSLPFLFDHPFAFNLIAFDDYANGRGDFMRQIILNVVMTVPFGFLFPLTRRRSKRTMVSTVFATFLLSFAIEILQPFVNSYRSFDVTDLITNTFGGFIGYCCFMGIRPIIELNMRKKTIHKKNSRRMEKIKSA